MHLKVAAVPFLVAHVWASVLQPYGTGFSKYHGFQTFAKTRLEYRPGMTSMWTTNEQGALVEVFLEEKTEIANLHSNVENSVFFYLYTRQYNNAYQLYIDDLERLTASTFDPSQPTKVLIHGFDNSYQSDAEQVIREVYLNDRDLNIVAVDWRTLAAAPWYFGATCNVQPVGQQVALLIDFLISAGADVTSFHLIGHSLGAHVASFAANYVTSGKIPRITGLDPALPLFSSRPPQDRLDPTDAETVDCIHSCGGYLGFYTPLCTHDFYPNGGKPSQPGCGWDLTGDCSHGRSFRYFSASIVMNFSALSCASITQVKQRRCSGNVTALMGDPAVYSNPGVYYLETDQYYPYAKTGQVH